VTPQLSVHNPNGYSRVIAWMACPAHCADLAAVKTLHRYQRPHSDSKLTRCARLAGRARCQRRKLLNLEAVCVDSPPCVPDWNRFANYFHKAPTARKQPAINRLQDVAVEVSCYQQLVMSTDKPCVFNEISRKPDSTLGTSLESTISSVSGNFGIRNQTPQR